MLRLLDVRPGMRVLDVGLRAPAGRPHSWPVSSARRDEVIGVELEPSLVEFGTGNLAATGQTWARIGQATPGVLGDPDHAPYDRILVSAEPATLPASSSTSWPTVVDW